MVNGILVINKIVVKIWGLLDIKGIVYPLRTKGYRGTDKDFLLVSSTGPGLVVGIGSIPHVVPSANTSTHRGLPCGSRIRDNPSYAGNKYCQEQEAMNRLHGFN